MKNKEESIIKSVSSKFLHEINIFAVNQEVPPFSTLNEDVIPTPSLLEAIDKHQAKFDPDLIKEIWKTTGVQTSDERVLKIASVILEMQMLRII